MSNSTCLSGAEPIRLSEANICNSGFHCPNNTQTDPPQYCPPTASCQYIRLQALRNTCPEPQGHLEPTICPPGSYCPEGGKTIIQCPAKHLCPLGTMEPIKCGAMSICPSGSVREFNLIGFFIVILIDLALCVLSWWLSRRLRRKAAFCRLAKDVEENVQLTRAERSWFTNDDQSSIGDLDDFVSVDVQDYVASVSRCLGGEQTGLEFGFEDLSCNIPGTDIEIISSMSGVIRKGKLCAVMGASGAGKSTFVDLLIGRKEPKTGCTYVNSQEMMLSKYKNVIGYVPQDDVLLPELTVRETMMHSARIRLPRSWTNFECERHLDLLLQCLGLEHVQHSVIGDCDSHTLSGGERKRVSIGIELAAAPMALFLDEPTSGLDSASALSVVKLLRQLTKAGLTIVLIIHQPRKEIFSCLDDLILLDKGHQIYHGPQDNVRSYFERLGYSTFDTSNTADLIIDIISAGSKPMADTNNNTGSTVSEKTTIPTWSNTRPISKDHTAIHGSLAPASHRGAVWFLQLWLCFARSLKQQQRRVSGFYLEIGVGGIAGLIIGLSLYSYQGQHFQGIYLPPFERLSSSVNSNTAAMIALMVCMAIGLAASPSGVKTFGEEKLVYWKESSSGHSRSAYYVGKVLSTFPRLAISALHFTSFYAILATPTMSFWENYGVVVLYFYAIYGLASCCSLAVSRQDGPLVAVIVCLIVSVLGGYGPSLYTVKQWHLEWMWRMFPGTWASEAYIDRTFRRAAYLYDIEGAARATGFTLGRYGLDISIVFILGTIYRLIAFVGILILGGVRRA